MLSAGFAWQYEEADTAGWPGWRGGEDGEDETGG